MVCLPGGLMQDSGYLGNLGGLSRRLQLILLDYRGTGHSESPTDPHSYRCDRLVNDVEALREHLVLERIDLLAHCAGANLAALYAVRHPRARKLVLITPSTRAVGITATSEMRREIVRLREAEPWFVAASTAFEAIQAGQATDADWEAITPFTYGRWDAAARAHQANGDKQRNEQVAAVFGSDGAFDPTVTRAALATFGAPVLLLGGELDVAAPAERRGEVGRVVPARHARHPAGRRTLPLARRPRLVHPDHRSVPGVTTWHEAVAAHSGHRRTTDLLRCYGERNTARMSERSKNSAISRADLGPLSGSAPAFNSIVTMSVALRNTAAPRAVWPLSLDRSTSAPWSKSRRTTSS